MDLARAITELFTCGTLMLKVTFTVLHKCYELVLIQCKVITFPFTNTSQDKSQVYSYLRHCLTLGHKLIADLHSGVAQGFQHVS